MEIDLAIQKPWFFKETMESDTDMLINILVI